MAGEDDQNINNQPPNPPPPTQQAPHTVSTIKLPILKKGEYDIWAMKMEHYLAHTDYLVWEVIQNGNGPVSISTDTQGQIKILPPKSAEEILARERERKARTTLLMALPEDHLARFHNISDAKEMWDAIKTRFGGNAKNTGHIVLVSKKVCVLNESRLKQNINNQPSNPPPPTQQASHTVSTIKLPILKKGEYDIWAMKMEHYLAHTDYPPPKSVEEILARERERKTRTTLLMALLEDHLARFHNISDAKEIWDAIKTRFGGNAEKMLQR
ncbi:hypothetical protein Tco_0673564 [Tanacetum coccineum]